MLDVRELTISQIHASLQDSDYTSTDLTHAYLDRIAKLDKDGPKINSTMALSPYALDHAKALDAYLAKEKQLKGPLHGIPILLKDQVDTAGIETRYGSHAGKGNIPTEDAFIVTKLKDAGAIILGKTTMSEWATSWFSASSATDFTFTHNPYKKDYDVGGSSGGSAAAVAANFTVVAVAEDTGGSVRCPASFCNLVGLRCTPGLISRRGLCPLLKVQDTPGPVARTVEDCARFFDAMVGFDEGDEWTGVHLQSPAKESYAEGLDPDAIKGMKIGVVTSLFGPDSDPYCKAVNSVVRPAIEKLKSNGTTFVDVEIENLDYYMSTTATYLERSRSDINSFLATKPHMPHDIADIVQPSFIQDRPFLDLTNGVARGPKDPTSSPTYAKKLVDRDEFVRKLSCVMYSQQLDALVFPDVQIPPPKHEDATNGRFPQAWDFPVNTLLASQARWPAITVPAGFTDEGLPVGMEFVSWEFREKALLRIGKGVEKVLNARRAPEL
ncbi:putative amidase family protein [Lophiotrema nucula]|uniref:Putative amidase family protein n=1 Tax=Lophiotrema nucula TaxID=690887 RepID=A0A6A5ZDG9_9PLEO|nr:putative amidase family protein [Lophiotrema nucula]